MSEMPGLVRDRSERSQQWFDLEAIGPERTHLPGFRCDQHRAIMSNNDPVHHMYKSAKLIQCEEILIVKRNVSPVCVMDQCQTAFSQVFSPFRYLIRTLKIMS